MSKRRILIIEDEKDIAQILKDYLGMNGFEVEVAHDGRTGLEKNEVFKPDFIILDIMLPDMDGIEICRQIRGMSNVHILILSARGSDTDKVMGLGFGADDYMTKPFSVSEVVARINAHLRRQNQLTQLENDILRFDNIVIDEKAYTIKVGDEAVNLSAKEFELLCYLAKHKNQVFSKNQLLDILWGYEEYADLNTITVYIRRIRKKIEPDPSNPKYIKTVWGVGYKFDGE